MLDFSNTVDVGLLIDDASVALREATIGHGGILCAKELAFTFVTPRANDLKWRYVVDSYHKGTTPEATFFIGTLTASVWQAHAASFLHPCLARRVVHGSKV